MSTSVPPEMLREVIRDVVREVIREVIAEEVAAGLAASAASGLAGASTPRRPADARPARAVAPSSTSDQAATFTRGALTERHVRAVGKSGTITIGRAVVITPLARERARAMGVEIIRIEG